MLKIDQPIVGYQVIKDSSPAEAKPDNLPDNAPNHDALLETTQGSSGSAPVITEMHEGLARPEILMGSTYKIKAPVLSHAMYITINDIVLNPGTAHEEHRPFEVFVNSKNMEQFQWIVALTRVMSAVFRKGGDVAFLVEELKAVFDPNGGYYKRGGVFMPSLVAEIGGVIEQHLKTIGVITNSLSPEQLDLIAQKITALASAQASPQASPFQSPDMEAVEVKPNQSTSSEFPANAEMCKKCFTKAVMILDGCRTCLNCGDSKCG